MESDAMHCGGCLCGTIRYKFDGELGSAGLLPLLALPQGARRSVRSGHSSVRRRIQDYSQCRRARRLRGGFGTASVFLRAMRLADLHCSRHLPDISRLRIVGLDTPLPKQGPDQHIFVGSKADWDHNNDHASQHLERA